MRFVSQVSEVAANEPEHQALVRLDHLVIHRFDTHLNGVEMKDAVSVANAFHDTRPFMAGAYTGGKMGYHFIINGETVYQGLPLSVRGVHAINFNARSLAIAIIGDFRRRAPSPLQFDTARDLCVILQREFPNTIIRGHDELPGGSADPHKRCPGDSWSMGEFRKQVEFAHTRKDLQTPKGMLSLANA